MSSDTHEDDPRPVDEALTGLAHAQMPFALMLGLEIVEGSPQRVVGRASWAPERCTAGGVLHGGYVMACADSVGGMLALMNLPNDAVGTTTIDSKTNLMGAVSSGHILAVATPLHTGRTTVVVQTDVTDESGRLVARTTQTQLVLRPG